MLLMGTSAAAVPAAATSVKVPISSYLICELKILFSFFFFFFFHFFCREEKRGEERSFQLVCAYRSLLNLPTPALGNFADRVARDRLDHVLTVGHDDCAALIRVSVNSNKARRGEFVDFGTCPTVQVQRDAIAFFLRLSAVSQDGSIVATDLGTSRTLRRGAIKILQNETCYGMNAVVDACGHDVDQKGILLRWVQTKLCTGSKKKWSNVHACTSSVRWNICCIQTDSQMHRFLEQLDWYCGHADVRRRVLHPLRIGFWSENSNRLVVRSTRGLQSFVALHAVVEARCHAMEAEKWIVHKLGSSPFSRLGGVSGLDVTVHFVISSVPNLWNAFSRGEAFTRLQTYLHGL